MSQNRIINGLQLERGLDYAYASNQAYQVWMDNIKLTKNLWPGMYVEDLLGWYRPDSSKKDTRAYQTSQLAEYIHERNFQYLVSKAGELIGRNAGAEVIPVLSGEDLPIASEE